MNGETSRHALRMLRGRPAFRKTGWLAFVASSVATAAVMMAMRKRRQARATEAAIDDRIAESFPASDPPWQP